MSSEINFPGRVRVGVVGLAENKANSAQVELEAGAELGNSIMSIICIIPLCQ